MYLSRNSGLWLVLLVLLLAACERKAQRRAQAFYDLDSLLNTQITRLVELQPSLEKEAVINGESEKVVLRDLDSASWAREFEIFRQLDLNEKTRKDRKSTRLNSSHVKISYAVFCLKKKNITEKRYSNKQ